MRAERGLWLAALGGASACLAILGVGVLDPRETRWLLSHTDSATGFLGWLFFGQAPLAQLPFGANPAYGMEIASSVVYSDSIPLAAFLFKPLSAALPDSFQYFGLWLALSFVLQSVFAYRLLVRFGADQLFALIGAAFFVLAPPYLFRLEGHFALCAQWLVLAALYLYFARRFRPAAWVVLLAGTALVHFYLLTMVCLIWAGDVWQRCWRGEIAWRQAAAWLAGGLVAIAAVLWFAGYFMAGSGALAAPGFGLYRLNLAALVDADSVWSAILPDIPGGEGDFEGNSYLGTGMLLLALLASYCLFAKRPTLDVRTAVPLVAVSLILTLVAISNRVALGTLELFAYPLPDPLQPLAGMVRSSGRLFWPVYYLLYLAILVLVFRGFARPVAMAACALALAAQLLDSGRGIGRHAERLARAPVWASPLQSPLWRELGVRYRNLVYVLPRNAPDAFLPWAVFAAEHRMRINFGYFARVDAEKLLAARTALETEIVANRLRPDTLYVFESAPLWNMATSQKRPADVVGVLDGFRVIAPALAECRACDLRALGDVKREVITGYALGERIAFGLGSAGLRPASAGWSPPEDWGMWSQASIASVIVKLGWLPQSDLLLDVEARAFVDERYPQQRVRISVNGHALEPVTFSSRAGASRTLRVSQFALAGSKGVLQIGFAFPDARVPNAPGPAEERRPRALGLVALSLRQP